MSPADWSNIFPLASGHDDNDYDVYDDDSM